MIRVFIFCIKALYWLIIGWWLEPIKLIIKMKKNKMEKEILKEQYNQLKQKQKEEKELKIKSANN